MMIDYIIELESRNGQCIKWLKIIVITSIIFSFKNSRLYGQYNRKENIDYQMGMGFGVGSEFGVSGVLPKVSLNRFHKHTKLENYLGVELTPWVWGATIISTNILAGIKFNYVTFDSSLGSLWYLNTEESGSFNHVTINPKLGLKLGQIWFKVGPSFLLYENYDPDPPRVLQPIKIKGLNYNFEILLVQNL